MYRLYSGNLIAFRSVRERLYAMDFSVAVVNDYHTIDMLNEMHVVVGDRAGYTYAAETFRHYDLDVLYLQATYFLNKLADQLETWR